MSNLKTDEDDDFITSASPETEPDEADAAFEPRGKSDRAGLGARPALGLSPAGHPGERDADQGMGLLFRVQWAYRSRADDCGQRVYGTRFGLVSRF